ncbi:MAG TPA: insulinase family protein [Saprospiraceae bacterium]|nr:insulinase family protein [Saprospiraceae bacterium]HMQ83605.1 insulinase family protein [Saprospiraceae bacterium]
MKKITSIILFALLTTFGLLAQNKEEFRKKAPQAGSAPKIELGDYHQFTLENGLQVIVVENHKLPRVSFQVLVDLPLLLEGEKAGLSALAGDMLARGTASKSKAQIDQAVDFIGATFSTSADGMFGACLSRHQDKLLEIMSDILLNPSFPADEFDKLKKKEISNLAYQKDNPSFMAGNVAKTVNYGSDYPYGEVVTDASLEKVALEDCKSYYSTYFKPNISFLAIVGDVELEAAKKLAAKYFGTWKQGEIDKPFFQRPKAPQATKVAFADKPGAVQSVIQVTYPINLKPGTEEAIKTQVLNTLLGGGILGSRLNANLREDKGYTYGANSQMRPDRHVSRFFATANVRNEVTDSAVVEILHEMNRLATETITAAELQSIKNFITGQFARNLESPQNIATFALNIARYKLPEDYYATYLEKIQAVTPEDVMATAKLYLLPQQANIVVAGNKEAVADKLKHFSGDETISFYDAFGRLIDVKSDAIPEGLTAAMVIEDYLNAIGGREKLEKIQDATFIMTSTVQGMDLNITFLRKTPHKMSMKVDMNGMVVQSSVLNGDKGKQSAMGKVEALEGAATADMKRQSEIFPELKYKDEGYKLELLGVETLGDKKAYKIKVTDPSGLASTEYYDTKGSLKLREITTQQSGQGAGTVVTFDMKDYQDVSGVIIPFEMTSTGAAPFSIVMKLQAASFNDNLGDEAFIVE